ncbi:energy transducer TonB [Flavobacterium aquidurense]|uniref:Gram-negative bacterial tonB protein n=1 Tax=Flavobacterium aquidurense TaxID=362413 RepID=A0A0Q0WBF3_9FLAO|nr:energy transducer TonB [Flavobacterium aquidurense]KQB41651.1 Gram-negative bacterial tonB protein [Flavobacterium aquidurense]
MSKSSIYEASWTNLVFENKNKEYGAYQLRQENSKTTITALFMGLLLLAALGSVSVLINKFRSSQVEIIPTDPGPMIVTPYEVHPIIPKTEEKVLPQQQSAAAAPSTSTQLTNPIITAPEQATPEIATNANNVTGVENPTGTGTALNATPTTGGGGGEAVVPVITNDPVNPAILDKLPEFPGGMAKFYTFVGNNFNRPELDAEKTLKVYVSFVVERDGSLTDIMVKNDPGYGIGKEAIRVLKSLKTKWIPGVLNGQAVRTAYNLPITIKTEAE